MTLLKGCNCDIDCNVITLCIKHYDTIKETGSLKIGDDVFDSKDLKKKARFR